MWASACLLVLSGCGDRQAADAPPAKVVRTASSETRFVKLEALSEWNGKPWAAMAELTLLDGTGAPIDPARWTATADSSGANDLPAYAIDGNPKTHWHSRWEGPDVAPPPPHWFVIALGVPARVTGFRYLPRQDGVVNGVIAKYRFYLSSDGMNWGDPVASGDFASNGEPSSEKVVVFAEHTANHPPAVKTPPSSEARMGQPLSIRIEASDADGDPITYAASGLPQGLAISKANGTITGTPIEPGAYPIEVQVADGKATPTRVTFSITVQKPAIDAKASLPPGEIRFVKLQEVSEVQGKPWAAMAEFNVIGADGANLSRTGWVASADSADTSDQAVNAIDGNTGSLWHTQWDGAAPPPPHSFIVDLGHGARIKGFRYLPRQDGLANGTIARFRFYTSVDGVDWGNPVAEGDFTTMGPPASEKSVVIR